MMRGGGGVGVVPGVVMISQALVGCSDRQLATVLIAIVMIVLIIGK
jgi:hypothetical protein